MSSSRQAGLHEFPECVGQPRPRRLDPSSAGRCCQPREECTTSELSLAERVVPCICPLKRLVSRFSSAGVSENGRALGGKSIEPLMGSAGLPS